MTITYRRLNPLTREIRLLEIQPAHNLDDPVKCRLITFRHHEDLEYIAISSLYGDPSETETVYVSRRAVTLTTHLAQALKQVRAFFYQSTTKQHQQPLPARFLNGAPRWVKHIFDLSGSYSRDGEMDRPGVLRVWLDILCVNQSDEWEKSKQHVEMKHIYSYADLVVGWLGEKAEHTDAAIATMSEIEEAMPATWGEPGDREKNPEDYSPTHRWTESIKYMWAPGPNGELACTRPHWIGCVEFMTRPYFQRRWIIEEITTAKFPAFLVGDTLVPWRHALSLYRLMDEFKFSPSDIFPPHLIPAVAELPLETTQTLLDEFVKDKPRQAKDDGSRRSSLTRFGEQ
ncbi:heterokaryon incompatibility protein-domain-containing protein [Dactylonectria estremocensis]|uniref:Heterokaryon incompatibility protein-domain-containing protein n=1 Tax=Dactylonectria estremocensis TaxID=1079267 RepID=A0A9P9J1S4_9HYPO|nr:heterokaryon incompatibility protein-domain-containing protein [Dactylonectria estremocensis]